MMVPILYSEIFDHAPTVDELRATLARLDWRYVVTLSVGIASTSWQRGIEDPRQQQDLAMNTLPSLTYGSRLLELLAAAPYRRLYTREALFGVCKIAVMDRHISEEPAHDAMDVLVRSVLMANELTTLELLPANITHTATDLTRSEVRSHVLRLQNPHDLLARTAAFMHWSETAEARARPDYLPAVQDVQRFFGISWLDYAGCAYLMLSRYASMTDWAAVERERIFFAPELWLQNLKDDAPIRRWLQSNTITVDALADKWRMGRSISLASAGPLWRTPMIADDRTTFIASPELLTNSMGEGVYFALFDSYGAETGDSKKKLQFSRFYGDFFEAYITGILQRGYAQRADATVHPNFAYSAGDSTDAIVVEGDNVIFIEMVAKRMKFVESVLNLDEQAILDDIAAGVIKKARELDKHIRNFRRGILLPDAPRPDGQKIFPVIVSPNDWPRIRILSDVLPKAQEAENLLDGTQPIELLDAGEVEMLETAVGAGLRLSDLLFRKNNATKPNRMMSLNNYLIYIEPNATKDEPTAARERGAKIAEEIRVMTMSWFKDVTGRTSP